MFAQTLSRSALSSKQVAGQPQLRVTAKPGIRVASKPQNRTQVVTMATANGAEKQQAGGGFDSGGAMWGGRFEEKVSDVVERFGQSMSFDKKMYKQVRISVPYLYMLVCRFAVTDAKPSNLRTRWARGLSTGVDAISPPMFFLARGPHRSWLDISTLCGLFQERVSAMRQWVPFKSILPCDIRFSQTERTHTTQLYVGITRR